MSTARRMIPSRGDVIMVDLDPTIGHEQGGQRPALVISADSMNRSPADLVIIAPITGTDRGIQAHVKVAVGEGGLSKPSVIMADQIRTISLRRISRRLGVVSPSTMGQVEDFLRLVLDLA
jgi:mRNA interferase MazF